MKHLTSLVLLVFGVTGCATYSWYNPDKNTNEFNQDRYDCIQQSAASFPPMIQQQSYGNGYMTDSTTSCATTGSFTNCTTTPGTYHPPPMINVDVNQANRNNAFSACMNANGWTLRQNP